MLRRRSRLRLAGRAVSVIAHILLSYTGPSGSGTRAYRCGHRIGIVLGQQADVVPRGHEHRHGLQPGRLGATAEAVDAQRIVHERLLAIHQGQAAGPVDVVARRVDALPFVKQTQIIEAAIVLVHAANRDLHPPFAQRQRQLGEGHDRQFDPHARRLLAQRGKRLGHAEVLVLHDLLGHADGQRPRQHAAHGVDFRPDALQRLQRVAGQIQRDPARRGQLESRRAALAQAHAQVILDLADMATDGGLGHVELLLRGGESIGLGHGTKNPQGAQMALGEFGAESMHGSVLKGVEL